MSKGENSSICQALRCPRRIDPRPSASYQILTIWCWPTTIADAS
jgi:hypothetical protein